MRGSVFFAQADLLVQILPFVHAEDCLALKGGTAINFFVRDFPRLSVDIDLVYLPVQDRASSLQGIDAALQRIATKLRRALPGLKVREQLSSDEKLLVKLGVRASGGAEVTIEPNTVLRGVLHPVQERTLAPSAVGVFGRSVTMRVVSGHGACSRGTQALVLGPRLNSHRPMRSNHTSLQVAICITGRF